MKRGRVGIEGCGNTGSKEGAEKMQLKHCPNHRRYICVLRQMSPEKRLLKAFELSAFSNGLFLHGLRRRFPELPDEEIKRLYLERIAKCYNRNY